MKGHGLLLSLRERWRVADGVSQLIAVVVWIVASGMVLMAGAGAIFEGYIEPKAGRSLWQTVSPLLLVMIAALGIAALG